MAEHSSSSKKSAHDALIGRKMAACRARIKLTQRELADILGVKETTVSYWENGKRSTDWLIKTDKLCKALNSNLHEILKEFEEAIKETIIDEDTLPSEEELRALYENQRTSETTSKSNTKESQKIIGRKIATLRNDAGLTQRDLADKVGVQETAVSAWETGKRGLNWLVRSKRLCEALGCDLSELVRREEPTYEELLEMYKLGKLARVPK